ncbi:hypothetical protein [Fulvivirga lutimaris]|uniref:hypothetical protein n=1 Tax=Fulvivirga lutimaris TaxID=1819566 RepID=UPI0012BB721F|nr:hypothetical protein [Fulvivirga lutimaris]MTI38181.1 hypothetical protein [Fulvivirga lutimaris]
MKVWSKIALIYLVLVGIIGLLLRYSFVGDTGFIFQYLKHAHSHVAFLGWVFNALFVLIIHNSVSKLTSIKWQFYLFQLSIAGMMISFPLQGYGAVSIAFSTAHIFISVWFYFSVINRLNDSDPGMRWVKIGGFYMLISNIGPLMLAPIMILGLRDSFLYQYSLQHYLHFQYNGWFITTIIGLLIKFFNPKLNEKLLLLLLAWSTIPLLFLSVELIESNFIYRLIGGVAAAAQVIGSIWLAVALLKAVNSESKFIRLAIGTGLIFFVIKCLIQLTAVFPSLSAGFIQSHNAVIGYLHLIFLGVITNLLVTLFLKASFINTTTLSKTGFWLFNLGSIAMISILILSPLQIVQPYFMNLFLSACLIVVGMICLSERRLFS